MLRLLAVSGLLALVSLTGCAPVPPPPAGYYAPAPRYYAPPPPPQRCRAGYYDSWGRWHPPRCW